MPILDLDDTIIRVIIVIIIVFITTLITGRIAKYMKKTEKFSENMTAVYLIHDIINYSIYFIAIMITLQMFGIDLGGLLLSLGIVGIAVSLAAKDIFSNFMSGIVLILGKSIKVGETVEINNHKGNVERVSLRTTRIIDDNGIKHIVPNSVLTNNTYLQYKAPEKYRINIIIHLPLKFDVKEFEEYVVNKISRYENVLKNPKPALYSKGINKDWMELKVSFWIKNYKNKDKYKLIITNEIRKYIESGEKG
ncbi:mechanosensitive ion channel family protein [Methanobrevibacter oralis]|uniref:Miniconductance mechanosensitive channel MscM n=1 Tax=Methanobrevibacter oralis TaxID=66851 RepID=A0A166ARV0_METOA|nr:mechanosensitive ion channel domain-containing protein [Methanobrevibacter oralis]KZX12394.1 miniconductance mechanosensitive channel MscM precursor [Methanobrevibacter oralis]